MLPSLEQYRVLALTNEWTAILPEIALGTLALFLLLLELLLPARWQTRIGWVAIFSQIALFLGLVISYCHPTQVGITVVVFQGMLEISDQTEVARIFFLLCSILTGILAQLYLSSRRLPTVEFFHILLVITAAMMLLVQSTHFVLLFVCLETVTVGFYILVSYYRTQNESLEGGLKYLIQGALSSGILLFGIVLLYGVAGNPHLGGVAEPFSFVQLEVFLAKHPTHPLVVLGTLMVLSGLAFKMGVVPFHIWIPDVYQGAPLPVTAFLSVASKAAGFFLLIKLMAVDGPFHHLSSWLGPLLGAMAALSIIIGNITALGQYSPKRLIGLSGISHAGYMLMGVTAGILIPWAMSAVVYYLFIYLLGSYLVFYVMVHASPENDAQHELSDYTDLFQKSPLLGISLVTGLGSLAGIPPLAGFLAKVFLFIAAYEAQLHLLLLVAATGVVISIYYYFGWMRAAVFRPFVHPEKRMILSTLPGIFSYLLLLLIATVLLLGVFPGSFTGFIF